MNKFFSAIKNHKIAAVLVCVALVIGVGANNSSNNDKKDIVSNITKDTQVISNNVIDKNDTLKENITTKSSNTSNNSKSTTKSSKKSKTTTNNKSKKSTTKSPSSNYTVYITRTGSKYHRSGCRYLRKSKIKTSKNDALSMGYSACSVCKP